MRKVSFIVPFYNGKQYLDNLIFMVQANYEHVKRDTEVELIIVNDNPTDVLPVKIENGTIKIRVLNHDKNYGIHKTRIDGFYMSEGQYICFLDQDDKIHERFLRSQLDKINDADIIIANGKNNGNLIYEEGEDARRKINLKTYLGGDNYIVSPGQVLMRKDIVPDIWLNNILTINGADDYFLWILFLLEERRMAYNSEILYIHRNTGVNSSKDIIRMHESGKMVANFLYKSGKINENSFIEIVKKNEEAMKKKDIPKEVRIIQLFDKWMFMLEKGKKVSNYLINNNIKSISIYGYGRIGRHLYFQLKKSNVKVDYIIDKNADNIKVDEVEVLSIEKYISNDYYSDCVVIANNDNESIENKYWETKHIKVVMIDDLINSMDEEFD